MVYAIYIGVDFAYVVKEIKKEDLYDFAMEVLQKMELKVMVEAIEIGVESSNVCTGNKRE